MVQPSPRADRADHLRRKFSADKLRLQRCVHLQGHGGVEISEGIGYDERGVERVRRIRTLLQAMIAEDSLLQ
ncbi:MAG TPA: hypothetical protein VH643_22665 [Gemmataceae bacterium]|jgi:hypothetical protein